MAPESGRTKSSAALASAAWERRFAAAQPVQIVGARYYTGGPYRSYDVSSDGKRFLMIKADTDSETGLPASIIVVQNWFEELKRLLP